MRLHTHVNYPAEKSSRPGESLFLVAPPWPKNFSKEITVDESGDRVLSDSRPLQCSLNHRQSTLIFTIYGGATFSGPRLHAFPAINFARLLSYFLAAMHELSLISFMDGGPSVVEVDSGDPNGSLETLVDLESFRWILMALNNFGMDLNNLG